MKKLAMLTFFPLLNTFASSNFEDEILSEGAERFVNGGLTNKEVIEGYFIDPVLGKCNMRKALKDIHNATRKENEAFNK